MIFVLIYFLVLVLVFIIFFVLVLVFVNEFVIFSFFTIFVFVFVNENHTEVKTADLLVGLRTADDVGKTACDERQIGVVL